MKTFSKVPLVAIDKERRDQYLDTGYNTAVFTERFEQKQFVAEWLEVFDTVKHKLGTHWKHGVEDADFFMDSDWVPDRFLGIEVSNIAIVEPKVLQLVHEVISQIEPDYSIHICNSCVFLETADGEKYPDFDIFVEKDRILVYSESDEVVSRLGIVRVNQPTQARQRKPANASPPTQARQRKPKEP